MARQSTIMKMAKSPLMLKASMSTMFPFALAIDSVISVVNPGLSFPVAVITTKGSDILTVPLKRAVFRTSE